MKIVSRKNSSNGNVDIVCEKTSAFGMVKTKINYRSTKEAPTGYWNWSNISTKEDVDPLMVFRLDNYCNNEPHFDFIDDYILYQSFECPFDNKELSTCVFKKLRSISDINERRSYLKALGLEQKLDIYSHHKNCIKKRTLFKEY